ncbi:MAG: hypothetical protein ACFCUU_15875, partial [Cyclobacteriaceae bacterium]
LYEDFEYEIQRFFPNVKNAKFYRGVTFKFGYHTTLVANFEEPLPPLEEVNSLVNNFAFEWNEDLRNYFSTFIIKDVVFFTTKKATVYTKPPSKRCFK